MEFRLIAPELILAGLGLSLVTLGAVVKKNSRALAVVGVVGSLAALAVVLANFGLTQDLFSNQLRHDAYASFFKVVFLVILILLFTGSAQYVRDRRMPAGEFYALTTLATLGGFLMAGSLDLITIFLGLELLSIASYALAGLLKGDPRSQEASIKFFLVGALTTAVILFGISLLYGLAGTTSLTGIAAAVAGLSSAEFPLLAAAGLFLLAGLGVKIAAVPFHMWAPDTYDGAPTPVSAFLITASEAAAFAVLLRLFAVALPSLAERWQLILGLMALVTMTYGNVTAILQTRTKRMLAYSAIAQAGYVLVGLAVASPSGVSAVLYYVLVYALMTVGAFTVVLLLAGESLGEEIADFNGLSRRSPLVALMVTILMLSLIGIPPTAGFFGKLLLYRAAVDSGMVWLGLATVLNGVVSVPYYYRIVRNMYLEQGTTTAALTPTVPIAIVLILAVGGTLLLGIVPEPLARVVAAISLTP
ncbi:MAG: NADH-quinone oxidoreductase subunit N [Firmicutes bacterium]|nr:NADH-quinone oxidoreductase subunit N [Bacillota bacterium]